MAGVYQSLYTGDTASHVGIYDPALWTVATLTFSLVQLPPPLPSLLYKRIQCARGGYGFWASDMKINACRKVPLQVNFFRWQHFCVAFYESYLSTGRPIVYTHYSICRQLIYFKNKSLFVHSSFSKIHSLFIICKLFNFKASYVTE